VKKKVIYKLCQIFVSKNNNSLHLNIKMNFIFAKDVLYLKYLNLNLHMHIYCGMCSWHKRFSYYTYVCMHVCVLGP